MYFYKCRIEKKDDAIVYPVDINIIKEPFYSKELNEMVFKSDSVLDETVTTITKIEYEGFINQLNEVTDEDKINKISEINKACEQAIVGYFKATVDEVEYSFSNDTEAQSNFKDGMWALENNKVTSIKWTAYDSTGNVVRLDLDLAKLSDVNVARLTHQQTQVSKFRDVLEPKVKSATTIEEINAIVW